MRGAIYRHKKENRKQKLARYLSNRIDQHAIDEDVQLTIWSNEAMEAKSFEGFFLSDLEYGIKSHHDHLRKIIPILSLDKEPDTNTVYNLNKEMKAKF